MCGLVQSVVIHAMLAQGGRQQLRGLDAELAWETSVLHTPRRLAGLAVKKEKLHRLVGSISWSCEMIASGRDDCGGRFRRLFF